MKVYKNLYILLFVQLLVISAAVDLHANVSFPVSQSIISGGGVTGQSSAINFYNLVRDNTTLGRSAFIAIYAPEFKDYNDNPEFINTVLDPYLAAVKSRNYTVAEKKLIVLTGATMDGLELGYVQDALEDVSDPWDSSKKFYVYESSDGTAAMAIIDRFIEEFQTLYSKISPVKDSGTDSHSNTSTVVDHSGVMEIEKDAAIKEIKDYEDEAIGASGKITVAVQDLNRSAGLTKTAALADADIGTSTTKQKYLNDVTEAITAGEKNIRKIAAGYVTDIKDVNTSAASKLNTLAGSDPALATVYKQDVDAQAEKSEKHINTFVIDAVNDLNDLEQKIDKAINAATSTAAPTTSGSSTATGGTSTSTPTTTGGTATGTGTTASTTSGSSTVTKNDDSDDTWLGPVKDILGAVGGSIVAGLTGYAKVKFSAAKDYLTKKVGFELGLEDRDPTVPSGPPQKYHDFLENTGGKIHELVESSSSSVSDLITENANIRSRITDFMKDKMGIDDNEFSSLMDKLPGDTAADKMKNLYKNVKETVEEVKTSAASTKPSDILQKIGEVIDDEGPSSLFKDGNFNTQSLIDKVKTKLGIEDSPSGPDGPTSTVSGDSPSVDEPKIGSGTGISTLQKETLDSLSLDETQQQLLSESVNLSEMKSLGTLGERIDNLKDLVDKIQDEIGAEEATADQKSVLDDAKAKLSDAEAAEGDPVIA